MGTTEVERKTHKVQRKKGVKINRDLFEFSGGDEDFINILITRHEFSNEVHFLIF